MAEAPKTELWLSRLAFAGLASLLVFFQLLPLTAIPVIWAGPDLLLAATVAWLIRRPSAAPVYVIAALFLLADLMFQRPPGLYAALIVIMTETLRARAGSIRNMSLFLEWGTATMAILAVTLAYRLILALVVVPQAPLGLVLVQMIMTILAYPLVVLMAHLIFGIRRAAPGQVDSLGHRL